MADAAVSATAAARQHDVSNSSSSRSNEYCDPTPAAQVKTHYIVDG
jgi:hypothetical protein